MAALEMPTLVTRSLFHHHTNDSCRSYAADSTCFASVEASLLTPSRPCRTHHRFSDISQTHDLHLGWCYGCDMSHLLPPGPRSHFQLPRTSSTETAHPYSMDAACFCHLLLFRGTGLPSRQLFHSYSRAVRRLRSRCSILSHHGASGSTARL